MSDVDFIDSDEEEVTPGYKPPAKATINEIIQKDRDDKSLTRYKQMLLGNIPSVDISGPNVEMLKMFFDFEGRESASIDLTGDLMEIKETPIVIKEGVEYKIRFRFLVKREIAVGLKYTQRIFRKGIRVDRSSHMVGSYGPKTEPQEYVSPEAKAPSGMAQRGHYTVKSKFSDDDKETYLTWEWAFDVKKHWE